MFILLHDLGIDLKARPYIWISVHHPLEEVRMGETGQCLLIKLCDYIFVLEGQVITRSKKKTITLLHCLTKLTQLIFTKSMQLCRKHT